MNVVDCRARQIQADDGNTDAAHNRREQPVHKPAAKQFDKQGKQDIEQTCNNNAAHRLWNVCFVAVYDGLQRNDKSKGAAKEGRHSAARTEMKDNGAKSGSKQRHANVKPSQNRDKNCRTGHCERMLQTEQRHFSGANLWVRLRTRKQEMIRL